MVKLERRTRRAVWITVVILLVFVLMHAWQRVEQEASHTALSLASKRILERANYYKQQWLLAGQPTQLKINQKFIHYSVRGWLKPINEEQQIDCRYWFDLLYQERRVLEAEPVNVIDKSVGNDFICQIIYPRNQRLDIQLVEDAFNVTDSFTAE